MSTTRLARRTGPAALLLTVLLAASGFAQTPASKPTPPVEAQPGKNVLAIYHFTTSASYAYDFALSAGNAVEAGFVRSGRFTVVERNRFGILKDEDKFKEANTAEIVQKANRLGAKTLVTGHIVGVSEGDAKVGYFPGSEYVPGKKISQISLAFKIIDVESGEIKKSEIILGKGEGKTNAEAIQKAYEAIDALARAKIGEYLPQRFKFASIVKTDTRRKEEYLEQFKMWGGSDNGLKTDDLVEIYLVSSITDPNGKKIEEKQLLAQAKITEINSGATATCTVINGAKVGGTLLTPVKSQPGNVVIEYKGSLSKGK